MAKWLLLISSFLGVLALLEGVWAAQCTPDPTNPCMARCNGTQFDISKLFDYP